MEHDPSPIDIWREAVSMAEAGNMEGAERKLKWLEKFLYWILQRKRAIDPMTAQMNTVQWASHGLTIEEMLREKQLTWRGDWLFVWRWGIHSAEMGRKSDVDRSIEYLRRYLYAIGHGE